MSIENSVVKIISSVAVRDYASPWTRKEKGRAVGTGFCINISKKGKKLRILTNSHVVDEATKVTLIKQGSSTHYHAKVESILYECDLALLVLENDDPKFWEITPPLELGSMPPKSSEVNCYGYPLGGENISITRGVVSRVDVLMYMNISKGIAIQIDAPINPGNSGGPVMDASGKIAGVVFSGIDAIGIQNMGYIIPPFLIRYFLRYIKRYGEFKGLSYFGVSIQELENETLRKFVGIPPVQTGVLVNDVVDGSSSSGKLRVGDVMTKINGIDIDYDGNVKLDDVIRDFDADGKKPSEAYSEETVNYNSMIGLKVPGEKIKVSIIRKGKDKVIEIPLGIRDFLVPIASYQARPQYYIVAGLVFVPMTRMFILDKLADGSDVSYLAGMYGGGFPEKKGDQVIVLSDMLSTGLTYGYNADNNVLGEINGTEIRNMSQLKSVVESALGAGHKYITFTYKDTPDIHTFSVKDVKKFNKKIVIENIGDIPLTNV
jgi:S1-C subfamily serine protease